MMTVTRELLSGTPEKVSARLEELSRDLANPEYLAGTRLRMLAVELAQRPNLRVSLVTYRSEPPELEESQELEVVFTDDPYCEPVMIDRDHTGERCQITWDRWLPICNDTEIETAADMVASILNTCARMGANGPPARAGLDTARAGPELTKSINA
jgi:hypothetical protein